VVWLDVGLKGDRRLTVAKRITSLLVGGALAALCVGSAFATSFLEFDRAFGGKGSGGGGFSLDINLAFDGDGNVYVSDAATRIVQKLGPDGAYLFQYPGTDVEAPEVVLVEPGDIAVDRAGNIYVADTTIVAIPRGKDEASDGPTIYIYTPCVHQFDSSGAFVRTIPVDAPTALPKAPAIPVKQIIDSHGHHALAIQPTGYDRAIRIDVDPQGNLFVLDAERKSSQVVHKISPDGEKITSFGRYGSGDGEFDSPMDIAVGSDGSVLVADTGNHRLVRFDNDGDFVSAFASHGVGSAEVTAPAYLCATVDNRILVKDDTKFVRRELRSVSLEILSLSAFSGGQRLFRENAAINSFREPLTDTELLARRLGRLEELSLLDEIENDEQDELEDVALQKAVRLQNTLYHSVIHRVVRFGVDGTYIDSATYRLDQLDEDLNDLAFVGSDPMGNVYLQDESDYTLRRYFIVGFGIRLGDVDAISSTRVMNQTNEFLEDYEDIDQVADTTQDETVLNASQRFVFNYDVTPQLNLLLENTAILARRDGNQEYPEQVENGIRFEDENVDNDLYFGIRRIMNPNPYRYREMTLFVERADGTSRLDSDALFPELNKQASRQDGNSSSTLVGLDWDVFRNANLLVQYFDYNPSETSRNYTREFFDLEGNLYQVLRTQNQSKVFVGELNVKF